MEDGEPDVTVSQVLLCLCPEQVVEAGQLFLASHGDYTVNLRANRKNKLVNI